LGRHSQSRRDDAEAALDLAYQFVQPNAVERVRRGLAPRGLSQGRCRLMEWVSRAPAPPSDGNWPGAQKTSCTPSLSDVAMHTGLPSWVLAVRKRNPIWSSCRAEDRFLCFFALRMTTGPKIPGTVLPRRVFTQPGSFTSFRASASDFRFAPNNGPIAAPQRTSKRAMCGRLRVGKENLHVAGLVGAAMCSAFECGSHDRWP
jgi:hypothetical protein